MASGTVKNPIPQILIERVTIALSASASTHYTSVSKNVEKDGYTAIAVAAPQFNQAGYFAYSIQFYGSSITIGIAKASQSGSISSLNVYADVTYMKN